MGVWDFEGGFWGALREMYQDVLGFPQRLDVNAFVGLVYIEVLSTFDEIKLGYGDVTCRGYSAKARDWCQNMGAVSASWLAAGVFDLHLAPFGKDHLPIDGTYF